jgi:hypothetical protein
LDAGRHLPTCVVVGGVSGTASIASTFIQAVEIEVHAHSGTAAQHSAMVTPSQVTSPRLSQILAKISEFGLVLGPKFDMSNLGYVRTWAPQKLLC